MVTRPSHFVTSLLACCIMLTGCGGDEVADTYPVSGTVTYQGRPAEGAEVVLYRIGDTPLAGKSPIPSGTVGADGAFQLRSFSPGDGAPAGDYQVTVVWPEPVKPGVNSESVDRADKLRGKYADPGNSGLTATVSAASTTLPPIDLK